MQIHIVIEDNYKTSNWCAKIMEGLEKEIKYRRFNYIIQSAGFASNASDLIIVIGTSSLWIKKTVSLLKEKHSAHIVMISDQPYKMPVSNVSTDHYTAMREVLQYLSYCKKSSVAFYGVNPSSVSDLQRLSAFKNHGTVFYNHGNLKKCFLKFYESIDNFDAAICANDYAAVSLLQNLKSLSPEKADSLFIISFANTALAKLYKPAITTMSISYSEYGKAALQLYSVLSKNPGISHINISIKSELKIRDSTKNLPFEPNGFVYDYNSEENINFYDDNEIKPLVIIDKILSACDEIDLDIIQGIAFSHSYEVIAERNTMSVNGVKYRLKKLLEICGIADKRTLISVYNTYLKDQ